MNKVVMVMRWVHISLHRTEIQCRIELRVAIFERWRFPLSEMLKIAKMIFSTQLRKNCWISKTKTSKVGPFYSYFSTAYTNLAMRRQNYTCTNPTKFIKICWTECEFWITFKVFGEYKDENNSYLRIAYTNLAVRRLKYTCTNPAKFIKIYWMKCDILVINLAATAFQKHSFLRIVYPIQPDFRAADSFFSGGCWN